MYYKARQKQELSDAEMKQARDGFRGKLFRLRYSPQFIENNCDELLGIAHSEYARAVAQGIDIHDPVAWTIHCAWRRTQNHLQVENTRPRNVSTETLEPIADEEVLAPEDVVMIEDRARKIHEAVAKLSDDQKRVVALTFFEDFSVREAAKRLDWKPARVQHHRDMALRELRRFLPVTDSDELWIDVGVAAWLAVAGGGLLHLPGGFEAVLDKAAEGGSTLWAKAHELARRFTVGGGNDAASAVASSGVARTAGACATGAAIVCIAGASTGIVGPGLPGLTDHSEKSSPPHEAIHRPAHQPKRNAPPAAEPSNVVPRESAIDETPVAAVRVAKRDADADRKTQDAARSRSRSTPASSQKSEEKQVEAEMSAFAKAAGESGAVAPESEASPESAATSEVGSANSPTVVQTQPQTPTASTASTAESKTAAAEFGFEK